MATLVQVRGALIAIRKRLKTALASDLRCKAMRGPTPQYRTPQNAETQGLWVEVGRLGRGLSVELWVDHYCGSSSPKAWFGLSSRSPKRITKLLQSPPMTRLRKKLIARTDRDVTVNPPFRFSRSLRASEFDVLVREHYAGERDYLGVFCAYPWPVTRERRAAIVRDSTNLLATFCDAFAMTPERRAPGPWARPDPRSEKAAVRHVRRHLRKAGYQVRTREQEICGYDLHATRKSDELHIEVKGCAGAEGRFFISRTEYTASSTDPHWRLAVITNALGRPEPPRLLNGAQMRSIFRLDPVQWEGCRNRR
jgi:hypothetical protein